MEPCWSYHNSEKLPVSHLILSFFLKDLHVKTVTFTWQNKFSIFCMCLAPYDCQSTYLQNFMKINKLLRSPKRIKGCAIYFQNLFLTNKNIQICLSYFSDRLASWHDIAAVKNEYIMAYLPLYHYSRMIESLSVVLLQHNVSRVRRQNH